MQLPNVIVQVQPVPERFAIDKPVGGVSDAVTVPLVGPVPVLLTVTVKVADNVKLEMDKSAITNLLKEA